MAFDLPLTPTEPLARFIYSGRHVRTGARTPKPAAFLPNPHQHPLATSVYRIIGLSNSEVGDIGSNIGAARNGTLRACAQLEVRVVGKAGLGVDPNNDPPRHANIIGWADEKAARLEQASRLAADATLLDLTLTP